MLAKVNSYWGLSLLTDRIVAEPYSVDSFQNVQIPSMLYWHILGRMPNQILIVSHAFKRRRFVDLHLRQLGWSNSGIEYLGIDPPQDDRSRRQTETGERDAVDQWQQDPLGVLDALRDKRVKRGWRGWQPVFDWFESWGKSHDEDFPARLRVSIEDEQNWSLEEAERAVQTGSHALEHLDEDTELLS